MLSNFDVTSIYIDIQNILIENTFSLFKPPTSVNTIKKHVKTPLKTDNKCPNFRYTIHVNKSVKKCDD